MVVFNQATAKRLLPHSLRADGWVCKYPGVACRAVKVPQITFYICVKILSLPIGRLFRFESRRSFKSNVCMYVCTQKHVNLLYVPQSINAQKNISVTSYGWLSKYHTNCCFMITDGESFSLNEYFHMCSRHMYNFHYNKTILIKIYEHTYIYIHMYVVH